MDSIKSTADNLASSVQNTGSSEGQQGSLSETVSKGVEYLQEKATGASSTANTDSGIQGSDGTTDATTPSKDDVKEAHPEKIQEFLRDKYKSDPNNFPDVKTGNEK